MFFDDTPNSSDHPARPWRRDNRRHIVSDAHLATIIHANKP